MSKDIPAEQPSIEQRVNTLVDSMVKTEDDKWTLPEGTDASAEMQYAAMSERRRRDTQGEYGRGQQQLKAMTAENERLASGWEKDATASLTKEQRDDLELLKHEDPDAWRVKLNEYEQANRTAFGEKRASIKTEVQNETELEKRTRLLDEHNAANPDNQLTDDTIDNDLPPRFLKQLESGELDFEQFITKSAEYLGKGKVLAPGATPPAEPNLGKAGGSSKPTDTAVAGDIAKTYKNEIY